MKLLETQQSGFVLLITLMILSISTIVVTQIFFQGRLYNAFIPIVLEKEKARQIALSGISIACAQLSLQDTFFNKKEKEIDTKNNALEKDKKPTEQDNKKHAKNLLKTLLKINGEWQRFVLTHEADGIDAQLSICITCENGKINLNNLYDFKKHTFAQAPFMSIPDIFKTLAQATKKFTNNKDIFENIQATLKKRDQPLFEITQVLDPMLLDEFKDYIFYIPDAPPFENVDKKHIASSEKKPKIYLADLFTVFTCEIEICPWIFSPSVKKIFNISSNKKEIDELLEKISMDSIVWKNDWDLYLKPLYGVDFKSLPKEVVPFLSTKFEPSLFSVLCYSKVGRVVQKLLVILERSATETGESIFVRKFYWL